MGYLDEYRAAYADDQDSVRPPLPAPAPTDPTVRRVAQVIDCFAHQPTLPGTRGQQIASQLAGERLLRSRRPAIKGAPDESCREWDEWMKDRVHDLEVEVEQLTAALRRIRSAADGSPTLLDPDDVHDWVDEAVSEATEEIDATLAGDENGAPR